MKRLLELAGPDGATAWRSSLRWLRALVLVHVAARSYLLFRAGPAAEGTVDLLRVGLIAVAIVGFAPKLSLLATRVAVVLVGIEIVVTVPFTANHVALEFLCLGLFALLDERKEGEDALLLQGLRWLIAVFFAATGLQKAFYGYYFDGQFLAYMAATEERFTLFFRHLIPADEMARLLSYNVAESRPGVFRPQVGAGPYRVDSIAFVLLSNAVWLFELIAGAALLVKPARAWAAVAAILFVVFIELAARELTFGALMINLLLLSLAGDWIKRCFWGFVAFYAYLVGHAIGWLPLFDYSPA